jgi:hypothetical protein
MSTELTGQFRARLNDSLVERETEGTWDEIRSRVVDWLTSDAVNAMQPDFEITVRQIRRIS